MNRRRRAPNSPLRLSTTLSPTAVRVALAVITLALFSIAFPTLYRWNRPFAFTSLLFPLLLSGAMLGSFAGGLAGLVVSAIAIVWSRRLQPSVMLALLPAAQVLVALALVATGTVVGWGRSILDRLRAAVAELEARHGAHMEDLEAAQAIQQSLLPQRPPDTPGITWSWVCEPSEEVGGDTLNYTALRSGRIALYLLDVSGHGLPAAMFSDALGRLIPVLWRRSPQLGPGAILDELNREFPMNQITGQYFTIVCAVLEVAEKSLTCASAGHPGPALLRSGSAAERVDLHGPPVGLIEDASFEESVLELAPGDRVVFYSDGITEALDPQMRPYGASRMLDRLGRHAALDRALNAVLDEVLGHSVGGTQDDLAMLAMELDKK